ncbi:MAG: hypothetical protein M1360_01235 [Candidatus Marsarchaeota archaeon]|jgi:hypothetical protein|nr:hypothetical protein [Candidatus Marsarchaeota archaeon]MCL5418544.1 hypothetical protein [Candidatus Marsarchaeota archaeon]
MATAKNAKSAKKSLDAIASALWSNPSDDNWKLLYNALKGSNARYYKIFYESLKNREDLTKSFARLYDSRLRPIARIPIIRRKGKGVEGATIYLKDLKNANIFD